MSASIIESLRALPTAEAIKSEHQISLIDQERPAERDDSIREDEEDAEPSGSEAPTAPPTPGAPPLAKRLTSNSLRVQSSLKREWTKRKYAKYGQNRYDLDVPPDSDPANQPQIGEPATPTQTSYLERGRAKAKTLLKRKRTLGKGKEHQDTVVDILYENQRGAFIFGIPKYSSSSLLPSDPRPWQNAHFRTSPVDIRNAQVPDPSWEWAWKSWYVDMSRDVDDEGWEYSFQFSGGFAWHGNHPWFHSFVRRRRWLRMRRRRDMHHKTKEKAHEFTAEYFTIHPSRSLRPGSENMSRIAESEMARLLREQAREEDTLDLEKMEITDIGSLIVALKKSAVDREKLVAVRKFIKEGGGELYYLSDRMPQIMGLFVFQSSRRQLLTELLQHYDDTHKQQEKLDSHSHDNDTDAAAAHEARARHAENLMNAVHAADEQVKKLEYWSDIKSMAQKGDTLGEDEGGDWDSRKWQGLASPTDEGEQHPEDVFKSKEDAKDGLRELHRHPEHGNPKESKAKEGKESKKTGKAATEGKNFDKPGKLTRKKTLDVWYDAKESNGSEDTTAAYSTAAESTSQISTKRQTKANTDSKPTASAKSFDGTGDIPPPSSKKKIDTSASVQIMAPVPEPPEDPKNSSTSLLLPATSAVVPEGPIKENLKDAVEDVKEAVGDVKEAVKPSGKKKEDGE